MRHSMVVALRPVPCLALLACVVLALAGTCRHQSCEDDEEHSGHDRAIEQEGLVSLLQTSISREASRNSELTDSYLSVGPSLAGMEHTTNEYVLQRYSVPRLIEALSNWSPSNVTKGLLAGAGLTIVSLLALFGPTLWKSIGSTGAPAKPNGSSNASEISAATNDSSNPQEPKSRTVLFYVLGHCLSASTLTVVNKCAMKAFHPPGTQHHSGYIWTISFIQFVSAALAAKLLGVFRIVKCDPLEMKQAFAYFPAAGMFMITIVAGNAVMNYANVSTFVVLRSLVPIPVALMETIIYKDPLPPVLSWVALCIVSGGAVLYGASIGGFEMSAITWALVFMVCMPIDALLIKHAISSARLSPWGLVYYNNTLAALPLFFFVVFFEVPNSQAFSEMVTALMAPEAKFAVTGSCFVGLSLSYFQMSTRFYISATAFMVLGVANKFLTVFWNEVFVDTDSKVALIGVLVALSGAVAWQRSMGSGSVKVRPKTESSQTTTAIGIVATLFCLAGAGIVQNWNLTTMHHHAPVSHKG